MTNGDQKFVEALKRRIWDQAELDPSEPGRAWEAVTSTRDLETTGEEKYLTMQIDQAIAERAEVFVGNGVSPSRFSCLFPTGGV